MEYTVMAANVIEQLRNGPPFAKAVWTFDPGDVLSPAWQGKTTKDLQAIDASRPDEWLIIQAWDES
jgi:hypothetical protein